jgi:hypothetical protein
LVTIITRESYASIGTIEHFLLDRVKHGLHSRFHVGERNWMFSARISADSDSLRFGEVVGTYFESERYTLNVPASVTIVR